MATKQQDYFYAIGRRKSATARIRLKSGKGVTTINGKPAEEYFAQSRHLLTELEEPFAALERENKFDISVVVSGGGHAGQADAIKQGIARALTIMNEDFKSMLKRADLLGRDPREKERKKFGFRSARKKRQFTKR